MYLPSQELSVTPYDQNILPQNIDEETGEVTSNHLDSTCSGVDIFSGLMQDLLRNGPTEEMLSTTFISIMATISICHMVFGFELLEKTGLTKTISPVVMFFFKYSLLTVTSHCLINAESSFPVKSSIMRNKRHVCWLRLALQLGRVLAPIEDKHMHIISCTIGVCMASCGGSIGNRKLGLLVSFGIYMLLQIMVFPILIRVNLSSEILMFMSIFQAVRSELQHSVIFFTDKKIKKLLPIALARVNKFSQILKEKKTWKFIGYVVGLVGTVIFQNFFRLTALDEVKSFMYLATSWVALLSVIGASEDFGILNFLLGNMILGSTVSQSGLKSTTWFICGVCLLLYALRLNLKSVSSQNLGMMRRYSFLYWIFFYLCTTVESLYCLVYKI